MNGSKLALIHASGLWRVILEPSNVINVVGLLDSRDVGIAMEANRPRVIILCSKKFDEFILIQRLCKSIDNPLYLQNIT
jgi:hypothetical protein